MSKKASQIAKMGARRAADLLLSNLSVRGAAIALAASGVIVASGGIALPIMATGAALSLTISSASQALDLQKLDQSIDEAADIKRLIKSSQKIEQLSGLMSIDSELAGEMGLIAKDEYDEIDLLTATPEEISRYPLSKITREQIYAALKALNAEVRETGEVTVRAPAILGYALGGSIIETELSSSISGLVEMKHALQSDVAHDLEFLGSSVYTPAMNMEGVGRDNPAVKFADRVEGNKERVALLKRLLKIQRAQLGVTSMVDSKVDEHIAQSSGLSGAASAFLAQGVLSGMSSFSSGSGHGIKDGLHSMLSHELEPTTMVVTAGGAVLRKAFRYQREKQVQQTQKDLSVSIIEARLSPMVPGYNTRSELKSAATRQMLKQKALETLQSDKTFCDAVSHLAAERKKLEESGNLHPDNPLYKKYLEVVQVRLTLPIYKQIHKLIRAERIKEADPVIIKFKKHFEDKIKLQAAQILTSDEMNFQKEKMLISHIIKLYPGQFEGEIENNFAQRLGAIAAGDLVAIKQLRDELMKVKVFGEDKTVSKLLKSDLADLVRFIDTNLTASANDRARSIIKESEEYKRYKELKQQIISRELERVVINPLLKAQAVIDIVDNEIKHHAANRKSRLQRFLNFMALTGACMVGQESSRKAYNPAALSRLSGKQRDMAPKVITTLNPLMVIESKRMMIAASAPQAGKGKLVLELSSEQSSLLYHAVEPGALGKLSPTSSIPGGIIAAHRNQANKRNPPI